MGVSSSSSRSASLSIPPYYKPSKTLNILDLPEDILALIFLDVSDVAALEQLSKKGP